MQLLPAYCRGTDSLTIPYMAALCCCRHRRKQLVKLLQADGTTGWVEMHELASNCSCVMLHRDPSTLPHMQQLRRLDSSQVARQHLLKVESQERVQLLVLLAMAPQRMLASAPPPSKQVGQGHSKW